MLRELRAAAIPLLLLTPPVAFRLIGTELGFH
jgi:hypothetical protein